MSDITIQELFGLSATVDDNAGTLTFSFNGLNDDIYLDGSPNGQVIDAASIDSSTINEWASAILWALITRVYYLQPSDNTEDDRGVYVTNQGKRSVTRNSVAQFAFQMLVSGYVNDNLGVVLPPNDIA